MTLRACEVDEIDNDELRRLAQAQQADRHVAVFREGGAITRASLWWRKVPQLADARLGAIGHYQAVDTDAARALLDACCAELRHAGCTRVVGPMDGNTWRRYRLVTWRGAEPHFALEPDNPDAYPAQWQTAGFAACASYHSSVVEALAAIDPRSPRIAERMEREGVRIRAIDPACFDDELGAIYRVAVPAFRSAYLYTPLPEPAFRAQYAAVATLLRPELCLLAECGGEPVGFVFAIPDAERLRRGERCDTVIVKTLAVLPDRRWAGLGRLLLERCQLAAQALGFERAIHALMHDDNRSTQLGIGARCIRRYALYARELGGAAPSGSAAR